ncbi:MAG: hypothetical protein IAF38_20430 [Bacteroidia bacterium]|nr:hypothetical protein [Bacteroidia bacterium]
MKKKFPFIIIAVAVFGSLFFLACSKQSEGSGTAPEYSQDATTTGANPHASTAGSQTSTT